MTLHEKIKALLSVNYGSGDGYGSGYGSGYGYGDGIKRFNGETVYRIDGVNTLIRSVRGNTAHGAILNDDLTLTSCYIAKQDVFLRMAKRCAKQWRHCETSFSRICKKMSALIRSCAKQTARKHTRRSIFTTGTTA